MDSRASGSSDPRSKSLGSQSPWKSEPLEGTVGCLENKSWYISVNMMESRALLESSVRPCPLGLAEVLTSAHRRPLVGIGVTRGQKAT